MKRLIISISILCLLTSFGIVPTLAQEKWERPGALSQRTNEKVQYKLKLEEGQQYYYRTSRDGEFFDRSRYKQRPTMLQTIETGAEIAVNDIDSNGNVWATYTYRLLNIRIISQTHNIVYDSSKKAMPRSPVEQGYAALLGESFSLKITPEGRVAEIKGLDKMRSNVRNKLPRGPMQASTIESLNQYLNEEDVKHEIEESLAIYPEKPVGIGDSWGREFVSSGEFAKILSNTWTLKERKNGVAVIEVVSTIKPNLEAKPSKVGNERVSFRFSGKQQGIIEIQESTGLKIRSEVNQQMSGKITTARQGVPDKVTAMKIVGVITTSMNEREKARSIIGTNAVAEEQTGIENEESDAPKTNYVAELNKIGIAGRPESDNAAPYYLKAIELYVKQTEGLMVSTRSWPKELPGQQQTLLRKWVQDNSRALEQLQLGSRKPYCWFKHTGQTLHQTEMPHLSQMRDLARALRARAMLQAEDGNITSALNDIATLYTIGAQMSDGPKHLVEKLVGIAVKSLSIKTAFNILDKKMVNVVMMKNLEAKFKQLVTEYGEPFDIRGEKIYLQEQIETDPKYRGLKPYLKSTLEYYDTIAAKNTWQLHNEKTQSIAGDNPLIEMAGSGIPRVIEIESRIRADEQALITTLAVLRYNAESRRYPATLPHLVSAGYIKELPIDPFSNKPLVYKQTRQGFTLYSFGADFDDDGGLHSKWGSGDEGGDQVFWPVEQTQVTGRPSDRERPFAQTERPQRRGVTDAISPARPYLTDDDEEYVPARPRAGQETTSRSLHQAVVEGDIDQVNLLISKGADVNLRNRMNWTPLHTAIQNRRQAIVELLTTKGADVNAKDNRGQTPLHVAVNTSQKDAVELLIAKGADVNVMGSRGDNALSLAKKRQNTEIIDLLLKHGAKEPSPEDLMADRYYEQDNSYPSYEGQGTIRRGTGVIRGTRTISQSPVQVDILADPNEIRARIKTFAGLEKALEVIDANGQNEMRQWEQKRYDNRTMLIRTVQRQFEDEIGFVRKVAVEEKAKKTTETISGLLSRRQERFKKVSKELLAQKRELRQMQPTRGRGRARTSSRSTRGRSSQRGQPYGEEMTDTRYGRGDVMPGMNRYQSARGPTEQIDREAENEIRQWLQANIENKADLAKAVHEQIRLEISSIRNVAFEEEAKKTTATIDGVLLYRQTRFDEFFRKIEEEKQALQQQTQDPRIRGRGRYPQGGQVQQQNQPRTRRRR